MELSNLSLVIGSEEERDEEIISCCIVQEVRSVL